MMDVEIQLSEKVLQNIRKISYESAELFLSANDKTVPVLQDQLYKEIEKLLAQEQDDLYYPNEVNNWRIAYELSFSVDLPKYQTTDILTANFTDLMIIVQKLKLVEIDREQILQILKFLDASDDMECYLELMNRDIYRKIFQYLHHNDMINLCKSSKVIKTCVSSQNKRSFFFPEFKDNLLAAQEFYDYFTIHLTLSTFKEKFIVGISAFYYLKDNQIISYNWEHRKITIDIAQAGTITQIVNINHNLYILMNDGMIVTKNLFNGEETISIPIKNYIYMSANKDDLLVITIEGYRYIWNGYLRRICGPKYIVQIVDLTFNLRLVLTSNGNLYTCNDSYSGFKLIRYGIAKISKNGYYLLRIDGSVDIVCHNNLKEIKTNPLNDHIKIVKIIDCELSTLFLTIEGKISQYLEDKYIVHVDDVFYAKCKHGERRLYYAKEGKLWYKGMSNYLDINKDNNFLCYL